MKKKTKRQIARAASTLQTTFNALQVDKTQVAIATGAFALGGLVTALARDEQVRTHSRNLAIAVIDRMVGLVSDAQQKRRGGGDYMARADQQDDDDELDQHH